MRLKTLVGIEYANFEKYANCHIACGGDRSTKRWVGASVEWSPTLSVVKPIGPPELPEDSFRDTLFSSSTSPSISTFSLFHVSLAIMALKTVSTIDKLTARRTDQVFDSHKYVAHPS
jgi:hypothetical protein